MCVRDGCYLDTLFKMVKNKILLKLLFLRIFSSKAKDLQKKYNSEPYIYNYRRPRGGVVMGRLTSPPNDFGGAPPNFFSFYPHPFKIYPYPGGVVGTPNH